MEQLKPGKGILGAFAGVAVGFAQFYKQRDVPVEAIKRQLTIITVVTVVKAAFLDPVDQVVSVVEIQDDLAGSEGNGLDPFLDQQRLDLVSTGNNPLLEFVTAVGAQFHTVQRGLARLCLPKAPEPDPHAVAHGPRCPSSPRPAKQCAG